MSQRYHLNKLQGRAPQSFTKKYALLTLAATETTLVETVQLNKVSPGDTMKVAIVMMVLCLFLLCGVFLLFI